MSSDELSNLSDDDLFEAVLIRTGSKVDSFESPEEGIKALNDKERIFYAVSSLDLELDNGGLCQFFANSSREVASMVSECMRYIGADEHSKLYDDFICKYDIDVNDLSSFDSETEEEFSKQYERYPFDEFDDEFCYIEPLQDYLIKFIKENIKDF